MRKAAEGAEVGVFARTGTRQAKFAAILAETCNVSAAARAAGVAASTCYRWRAQDAGFAASWDAALGIGYDRLEAALLAFFRARMGPARGFRLRDPFDAAGEDEAIGVGDGVTRSFALVKHYGAAARRITRPVAGSVRVCIDNVEVQAFTLQPLGMIVFDAAPAAGAAIAASFAFDVPVRFAEDRLTVARATFRAGSAASVPLIEVREA